MRRIPEIDLARIAVLETPEQEIRLRGLKGFRPPHTLNPFRKAIGDIVNLQFELIGTSPSSDWVHVKREINRHCAKGNISELRYNLAIAKVVHEFCQKSDMLSFDKPTMPWTVGYGNSVSYWNNFYSVFDDQAAFIFFDPRLSNPLTKRARKFVFSIMNQRLRIADPDFAEANLMIAQFKKSGRWNRQISLHSSIEDDLYSEDELNEMISTTYSIWADILFEREQQARRAAGGQNPFGF
jgi:hypothetical protein